LHGSHKPSHNGFAVIRGKGQKERLAAILEIMKRREMEITLGYLATAIEVVIILAAFLVYRYLKSTELWRTIKGG
jgi:hypothetical protein